MKFGQLLIGIILGGLLGFGLTTFITNKQQLANAATHSVDSLSSSETWCLA